MQDGLALATDDLGGDFAPACSDFGPVEAVEFTPEKTGAASRVALINFFWSWTPKD